MLQGEHQSRTVRPLREVVGAGLSISDVSAISGISKSTLSRMWDSEKWVDKAHYSVIARLGVVLPSVGDYARWVMHAARLAESVATAQRCGLIVDLPAVQRAGSRVSPVDLALVLDAATDFARGRSHTAFRRLDLCWGARMDTSVSLVFEDGLIANHRELSERVMNLVERRPRWEASRSNIGHSIAIHKLTKSGFEFNTPPPSGGVDRASRFQRRNYVVGRAMAANDVDLVKAYANDVAANTLSRVTEIWSLASYSGDVRTSVDQQAVQRIKLEKTCRDVTADLLTHDGGYAYYLAHVAVPNLLIADRHFSGQRNALRDAVKAASERAENAGDRSLLHALARLIRNV